jgi:ribosomal protein S18 acetylase RimI-like enzyme
VEPGVTKPQQLSLREANRADEPFLDELHRDLLTADLAAFAWDSHQQHLFVEIQIKAKKQYYVQAFPSAWRRLILQGDKPVGAILTDADCNDLRLIDIAVLRLHRSQSIGTRVMRKLIVDTSRLGGVVRLCVGKSNAALGLYHRLGFRIEAETDTHYSMVSQVTGGEAFDAGSHA